MRLGDLLRGVGVRKLFTGSYGARLQLQELEIQGVRDDSRLVRPGDLFIALRGSSVDGHRYIDQAVQAGAVAVVLEEDSALPDALATRCSVTKIVVDDTRTALAVIAGAFFGHPSGKLRLVGVTGTNGKTTTAHLLRAILEASGERVGLVGTISYMIGQRSMPATHTTPSALGLNALLEAMVEEGCQSAVMEVSSHALDQRRVHDLVFAGAIFTNLTQDHLDYHGTMESYATAKKLLFDGLPIGAQAVINADDPWSAYMVRETRARVRTYGTGPGADVRSESVDVGLAGIGLTLKADGQSVSVQSPLTGRFNVWNILAATAAGRALGVSWESIQDGLQRVAAVSGRFERIVSPGGWTVIIDYAHTPDALQHALATIRELMPEDHPGRIITVFGCGGNRDRGKRPQMGRIASLGSDLTIVTSDNPRDEDPSAIIREIIAGAAPGRELVSEPDRRTAIRQALALAQAGDVILIAGKGHERVQEIAGRRLPFDDREEVQAVFKEQV